MEIWYLSAATVLFSVVGAAVVCGLTFGRLQGQVSVFSRTFGDRLDRIEREHTDVLRGLSGVTGRLDETAKLLAHINERMDNMVVKDDLSRIEQRLDLAISGKTNRVK